MVKFCKTCGAELPDNAMICTQCGTILGNGDYSLSGNAPEPRNPEDAPVYHEPVKPQKKKKAKWWLIPVAAILVLVIAVAFLWRPIMHRVAPRAYLAKSSVDTIQALSGRTDGSPLKLMEDVDTYLQKGTIGFKMEYSDAYSGNMALDLTMASDAEAKQWALHSDVTAMGENMDLDLYFDADCLALRANSIADGQYFGLNYDTFAEDLRGSYLGQTMDSEGIEYLTQMVECLDKGIDSNLDYETLLKPYLNILSGYIENLEPVADSKSIELDGETRKCETVSFTLEEAEIVDMLEKLLDELEDDEDLAGYFMYTAPYGEDADAVWDDMIEELRDALAEFEEESESDGVLTYYIFGGKLAAIGLETDFDETDGDGELGIDLLLAFGADPGTSDITLDVKVKADGETVKLRCVSSAENEGDVYKSTLTVTGSAEDSRLEMKLKTKWNRSSGKLNVSLNSDIDGEETAFDLDLKLLEKDGGIELSVDDLYGLMSQLDEDFAAYEDPFDCAITLTISQGCTIEKPEYTSFTEITEEMVMEWLGYGGSPDVDWDDDDWVDDDWEDDYDWDDDSSWEDDYAWMGDIGPIPKIIDNANVLSDEDEAILESTARYMTWLYEVDVVVVTSEIVNMELSDYADYFYTTGGYGWDGSGVIFVLTPENNQCVVRTYGDCEEAIPDVETFADTFMEGLIEGDYLGGINEYLFQIDSVYLYNYYFGAAADDWT